MPFPQRTIGDDKVSALGLGCMGMSFGYNSSGGFDEEASLAGTSYIPYYLPYPSYKIHKTNLPPKS